jgi:hypothetical protein
MDNTQRNHLKAYGIAYYVLTKDVEVSWLLNYRGGSFMFPHNALFEEECLVRGVSMQVIADVQANAILQEIANPEVNMEEIKLHKVPRIAVYTPPNSLPWDDAVTLALTYAEIPYDPIYDEQVLSGHFAHVRLAAPASRRLYRAVWQILVCLPQCALV